MSVEYRLKVRQDFEAAYPEACEMTTEQYNCLLVEYLFDRLECVELTNVVAIGKLATELKKGSKNGQEKSNR